MPLYAAHAPTGPLTLETADRTVLVPQTFCKAAFLFGPWWLVAKGLWRALAVWAVVSALLLAAALALGLPPLALFALQGLVALFLGLQAPALQSAALERSGLPLADLVAAPDPDVGLRAFFARRADAPEAPALPTIGAVAAPSPARRDALGLFPQPGGRA